MSLVLVNIIKENRVELPPRYRKKAINSTMISQLRQGKKYARFNFTPATGTYDYELQATDSAEYIATSSVSNEAKNITLDTRRQGTVTVSTANIIQASYFSDNEEEINVVCLNTRSRQVAYRVKERLDEFVARVNAVDVPEQTVLNTSVAIKTADTIKVNDNTYADDPHMAIPLDSNSHYTLKAFIYYNAHGTPDMKFRFGAMTGATIAWGYDWDSTAQTVYTGTTAVTVVGVSANRAILLVGTVYTSNAVTLAFQWAQNVSNANATTMKRGSWLEVTKL